MSARLSSRGLAVHHAGLDVKSGRPAGMTGSQRLASRESSRVESESEPGASGCQPRASGCQPGASGCQPRGRGLEPPGARATATAAHRLCSRVVRSALPAGLEVVTR